MKIDKNRQVLFFVSLIGIIVVTLIMGTTYAYQTLQVDYKEGSDNELTINVGKLNVTFTKSNIINLDNMSLLKSYKGADYVEFNINPNDTTSDVAFIINLVDINYGYKVDGTKTQGCRMATSELQAACLSSEDFKFTLVDSNDNVVYEGDFRDLSTTSTFTTEYKISDYITLKQGKSDTYRLYFWLSETEENQNSLENTYFQAKIDITSVFKSDIPSLENAILNSAKLAAKEGSTTRTIYKETPLTEPAKVISGENERTLSMTKDDYGNSYYFRGNVTDNYVNFANMCWRIVRIEGDGSIKITLAKEDLCSTITEDDLHTATLSFVEYGYTVDVESNNVYADYNNYSGGLKTTLEEWYENKFELADRQIFERKLKEDMWCLGANINYKYDPETGNYMTEEDVETQFNDNEVLHNKKFYSWLYASAKRILIDNTPSLKCSEAEDRFISKIGGLTIDEVVFAGDGIVGSSHYLNTNADYYSTISVSDFYLSGNNMWNSIDHFWVSNLHSGISTEMVTDDQVAAARPAVTLKANVLIESQEADGTQTNPYVIDMG